MIKNRKKAEFDGRKARPRLNRTSQRRTDTGERFQQGHVQDGRRRLPLSGTRGNGPAIRPGHKNTAETVLNTFRRAIIPPDDDVEAESNISSGLRWLCPRATANAISETSP